jgi:hypothetical protein
MLIASGDMRSKIIIPFAIILFLLNITDVNAGRIISDINVTTKVLPVVKYEIIHQEKNLIITEEDITRGFINIQRALIFSVKTNSKNGYVVTFFVGRDLFKEVIVFNNGGFNKIHETNNEVHMPFEGMKYMTKS